MADSVVTLWSKSADFSAAVPDFPGVFEKSLWDSEADATKFYGTNGTYISSDVVGSALTHAGAEFTISISDTTGILADMYVWIPETPSLNDEGYYRIKSVQANTTITCEDLALDVVGQVVENDTITHYIGGVSDAFDTSTTLQLEFDLIGPNCGATLGVSENNLDIICHASTALDLDATIDIDAISGSTTTRVRVIGTNSSFVDVGTKVELIASADPSGPLVQLGNSIIGVSFKGFIFNANDLATEAFAEPVGFGANGNVFYNCDFKNATAYGVNLKANANFFGCNFLDNVGGGVKVGQNNKSSLINNCRAEGNGGIGYDLTGPNCSVIASISFNNTVGIAIDSDIAVIDGCVLALCGIGITTKSFHTESKVTNTVFLSNTNYCVSLSFAPANFDNIFDHWSNNWAHDNGAYWDWGTEDQLTDAQWIALGLGNNGIGDPKLNATTFIPDSDSPLIDAGVGGDTIGAKCATAGSGAGGLLRHPGMNGGMNG